jgi:hypothetical protein
LSIILNLIRLGPMTENKFRELAEATLGHIHQMSRDLDQPVATLFYSRFMSAFMNGDLEKMQELQNSMELELKDAPKNIAKDLKELVALRMKLRLKTITSKDLEAAYSREFFDVLEAEKLFVIARSWEFLSDEASSMKASNQAAVAYKKFNCPKKSLRSFYNSVVAESRLTPYKNFISEYQAIIKMSQDVGDSSFSGMAFSMLSREFQIVGLHENAMKFAKKGIELLVEERGSFHYFNALLQKAHLLIEEKKPVRATMILLECKMAAFPEIRAARELLECAIDPQKGWSTELEKDLIPTWKERMQDLLSLNQTTGLILSEGPTSLEFKLLKLLWSGPIPKWDLIEKLYPQDSDSYAIENRFKNLVARLRKKYPEVLQFNDGQYFIQNKNQFDLSTLIGEVR